MAERRGVAGAVRIRAGECFVVRGERPFRLGSDGETLSIDAGTIFPPPTAGGVVRLNGGGGFALVGSRFAVAGRPAARLLAGLPPIIHVGGAADREALLWSVEAMRREMRERRPGGALVAQHLAHMMLVQALRLHLIDAAASGIGWFFALGDPRLALAIAAMHADPGRRWSLHDLARAAGMSRSSFALAFRARAGETPMNYLARWRMLLAAERLDDGHSIASIAPDLGYESESAFGAAFKRVMGSAPRAYNRVSAARRSGAEAA